MSSRDALARGLALAFLAGPWTSAGLLDRGERTLGERPRWLSRLVREMMALFEAAPNDANDRLREAIERASSFNRGLARAKPRSNLRTVLVSEPSMGARRWPVPILCTLPDLASWLAITTEELEWFADVRGLNGEVERTPLLHYSFTWLPKRRGGYRLLEAPKTRLKELQRRVLTGILSQVPPHDAAHGFVTGRSALSFARVQARRIGHESTPQRPASRARASGSPADERRPIRAPNPESRRGSPFPRIAARARGLDCPGQSRTCAKAEPVTRGVRA